jgi:hypothetical protein
MGIAHRTSSGRISRCVCLGSRMGTFFWTVQSMTSTYREYGSSEFESFV